jgi:hypothetical protein
MPTFLEAQPRDTNTLGHGGIEGELEDMEREYNSFCWDSEDRFLWGNIATSCTSGSLKYTIEVTMSWDARQGKWRCPTLMDLARFQLRHGYKIWMLILS